MVVILISYISSFCVLTLTAPVCEDHISRPPLFYIPLSEISKGDILAFISEHFFRYLTWTLLTLYFFL